MQPAQRTRSTFCLAGFVQAFNFINAFHVRAVFIMRSALNI